MQIYISCTPAIQPTMYPTLHPTLHPIARRALRLPTPQRLPHALVLAVLLLAFPSATLTTAGPARTPLTTSAFTTSSRFTSAPHAQAPAAALNATHARHLSTGARATQASVVIQSVRRTVAKVVRRAATAYAFTPSGGISGISQWAYTGHAAYWVGVLSGAYPGGQCTWYAWSRDTRLVGLGNADTWAANARSRGFTVTSTPRVGATVVLAPGVQGAGGLGHVGHVEAVYAGGYWLLISEMNFAWNGGGFARVDYRYIHVGPGVTFIL